MYPKLFGVIDSYTVMMILALLSAVITLFLYTKNKINKLEKIDLLIVICVTLVAGLLFANFYQNIYDLIKYKKEYHYTTAITFYGGLIGGAIFFFIMYFKFYKKHHPGIMKYIIRIAPICICLAHTLGRIGCFLEGCCYGIDSNAWYSLYFSSLGRSVIPTNLYEAVFVFIIFIVLLILLKKKNYLYTLPLYMFSYSIFRFLIEFIRGDDRAKIGVLSPSQYISILLFICAFITIALIRKHLKDEK